MKYWFYVLVFSLFIVVAIAWIVFARLSMARIEKNIERDGLPKKFRWDGVGGRVIFYACAIVFSERFALRINRLIDVSLVRSYANRADWWRGFVFLVVTYFWLMILFSGGLLGI